MLLKAGVDISRLERNTRRGLGIAEAVFNEQAEEIIVTSTYEGNHGGGSLHYADQAFDLRLVDHGQERMGVLLRDRLGIKFDVLVEGDHWHLEYDPD